MSAAQGVLGEKGVGVDSRCAGVGVGIGTGAGSSTSSSGERADVLWLKIIARTNKFKAN